MEIGENIRRFRKEKGLTQVALSEIAHISRTYLADVERGRYNPSVDTLSDIAEALNVKVSWLLGENNEESDHSSEFDHVSKNLQRICSDKKITAEELAKLSGLDTKIVKQYIDGEGVQAESNPQQFLIAVSELSKALDVNFGELYFENYDPEPYSVEDTISSMEFKAELDMYLNQRKNKKEAPAMLTAEALQQIAEEEAGRPLTDTELVLIRTRLEDLKTTLDQITKKKD